MKKNDILILLVPTLIFVIAWIGFSVWHNIVTSTISEDLSIQIAPIPGNFDTETIEGLKKRNNITPVFDANSSGIIEGEPSPTPAITIPVAGSQSAQQASSGGGLSQ